MKSVIKIAIGTAVGIMLFLIAAVVFMNVRKNLHDMKEASVSTQFAQKMSVLVRTHGKLSKMSTKDSQFASVRDTLRSQLFDATASTEMEQSLWDDMDKVYVNQVVRSHLSEDDCLPTPKTKFCAAMADLKRSRDESDKLNLDYVKLLINYKD